MRCDACEHWNNGPDNAEWVTTSIGFGKCLAVRERWRIQDEASEGVKWSGKEEDNYMKLRREALLVARAYVQDGSEYRAELFTAPDFFCALYSEGDQAKPHQEGCPAGDFGPCDCPLPNGHRGGEV